MTIEVEETLLRFPCQFPIKVMGKSGLALDLVVIEIVRRHVPDTLHSALSMRPSKGGNYMAITVLVEATSKIQLDSIYRDLTSHPHVIMAL